FCFVFFVFFFFFFSSRRRHTRSYGDWSSDVCSSDLHRSRSISNGGRRSWNHQRASRSRPADHATGEVTVMMPASVRPPVVFLDRSEERRVGKECRSRWAGYCEKKKKNIVKSGSSCIL